MKQRRGDQSSTSEAARGRSGRQQGFSPACFGFGEWQANQPRSGTDVDHVTKLRAAGERAWLDHYSHSEGKGRSGRKQGLWPACYKFLDCGRHANLRPGDPAAKLRAAPSYKRGAAAVLQLHEASNGGTTTSSSKAAEGSRGQKQGFRPRAWGFGQLRANQPQAGGTGVDPAAKLLAAPGYERGAAAG